MIQKILFVAAGSVQATAIAQVKKMGYKVYAMDGSPNAIGFNIADGYEIADICNPSEIVRVAKHFQVGAILSICTDAPLVAVAMACAELKLPSLTVHTAMMATNKLAQRIAMQTADLPVPYFQKFSSIAEAEKIANSFQFPVVIKPTDSAGSRGVTYVSTANEVQLAAQHALKNSRTGIGMIEAFMEGPEVSVEAFIIDGHFIPLCLSEKVRTKPPYLLDREVHFPPTFNKEEQDKILAMAQAAVKACELNNCPIHMELIRTSQGPRVVEVAARGAGFHVFTKILPHVLGVNTIQCCLDLALGKKPNIHPLCPPRGASLVFLDPTPGRFVSATHVDEARTLSGIEDIEIYPKQGDEIQELRSGADRIGHIFAFGETRTQAENIALKARNLIQIHIEAPHDS